VQAPAIITAKTASQNDFSGRVAVSVVTTEFINDLINSPLRMAAIQRKPGARVNATNFIVRSISSVLQTLSPEFAELVHFGTASLAASRCRQCEVLKVS
jgi:hypothetical protein